MKSSEWLSFYARHFSTVEINRSFYSLPNAEALVRWAALSPENFIFAFKASRYIPHMKKLKDPAEPSERMLDVTRVLGAKLGPILFQLPPRWRCDLKRLAAFLNALPRTQRFAFEFRDPSWLNETVYDLLRAHRCAFCIYDLAGFVSPRIVTTDFTYIRLHGPGASYKGRYGRNALRAWERRLSDWAEAGISTYCYFDNDEAGYAARDAADLIDMLCVTA